MNDETWVEESGEVVVLQPSVNGETWVEKGVNVLIFCNPTK